MAVALLRRGVPDLPPPRIGDLLAGLSVALVLIPQSLAYARLAGVPPHVGLYAAMLPPIVAAVLASSPYLQTGPVALTSILTFGALSVLTPPGSPEYLHQAALLALIVGIVRVTVGVARWGWVAYLLSQPVLTGFTSAAALLIIASQLPTMLGVAVEGSGILEGAFGSLGRVTEWRPAAIGLSAATILVVLGGRRVHPVFPGVLVAVIGGIVYARLFGYEGSSVGPVPAGLPPATLALPWGSLPALLVPGLVIALVGFAEPAAIARVYAEQERRPWSPNREFVSQGMANIAAGLSAAFPVGGSFSRTAINREAGAKTRWSGAVAGLATLAFLPFAGVLAPLPQAVLGAVVVAAVVKLVALRSLAALARYSLPQAGIGWVTFALTLALAPRLEQAVIVGVGLAGAVHIWRELRVHVRTSIDSGILHLEPQGVLFFGSAPTLEEALVDALARHPQAHRLVLDLELLGRIDYTGALALRNVVTEAERAGLQVELRDIPPHAERILSRLFGDRVRREREPE